MKLLLEALIAGSVLLGSCTAAQKTETLEQKIIEQTELHASDDFIRGKELKIRAEENPAQRKQFYESAANAFYTAMLKRNNTYDSMIEYADCLSQSGNVKNALEWIDKALYLQETEKALDAKGLICARHGFLSLAEDNFTKAIEKQDTAQYRWHRFQVRLKTAMTEQEYLDKSLEDIKKVTEFRPEEPEGYVFTAAVYGTMMFIKGDADYARDSYNSLKKAIELIDAGKKTKLTITEINELRSVYKMLKNQFEPAKTTFEEENY